MSSRVALTQRSFSPPPEFGRPAQCAERIPHTVTAEQIHVVLRDIIRRDPDLWSRVQGDQALWQAFGFETESEDTASPRAAGAAG